MKLRLLEVVLVILAIHPPSEIDRKVRTALCTQNGRSSLVQVLEFRTPSVTRWTYWRDALCPDLADRRDPPLRRHILDDTRRTW